MRQHCRAESPPLAFRSRSELFQQTVKVTPSMLRRRLLHHSDESGQTCWAALLSEQRGWVPVRSCEGLDVCVREAVQVQPLYANVNGGVGEGPSSRRKQVRLSALRQQLSPQPAATLCVLPRKQEQTWQRRVPTWNALPTPRRGCCRRASNAVEPRPFLRKRLHVLTLRIRLHQLFARITACV